MSLVFSSQLPSFSQLSSLLSIFFSQLFSLQPLSLLLFYVGNVLTLTVCHIEITSTNKHAAKFRKKIYVCTPFFYKFFSAQNRNISKQAYLRDALLLFVFQIPNANNLTKVENRLFAQYLKHKITNLFGFS